MSYKTCGYGILGVGMYVPDKILSNADLEKMVETSDEWIISRTGIKERRIAAPNQATSDLATEAARRALENAGVKAEELDLIICATVTPDTTAPNTACLIQAKLGIGGRCPAFDLSAACTGFVYGLSVATAFMRAGVYKKALVIGAETLSRVVDYKDRNTCVLFGDAAGAAIVGPTGPDRGLMGEWLSADGKMADQIVIYDSGSRIRTPEEKALHGSNIQMKGGDVFKFATRILGTAIQEALKSTGQPISVSDIKMLFPHQANLRIIESAAKRLDIPLEKVYVNIQKYGNSSAATIPVCLAEASAEDKLKPGDVIALVSFGGGLTYGASIWRW
ncbi:ketoacyl-ACP synthase III [Candidatus Sumerlaeota bacterium]|nr:ketoacyl-ACP synthase III [Candidatus Sumerlaeota bacterium]